MQPTVTEKPTNNKITFGENKENHGIFIGISKEDKSNKWTMKVGEKLQFYVYGIEDGTQDDYIYDWVSSDETIAMVDKGVVTAHLVGKVRIYVRLYNKNTKKHRMVAPVILDVLEKTKE